MIKRVGQLGGEITGAHYKGLCVCYANVCAMQNGENRTYLIVCCELNDIISGKALTTL